MTDVNWPTYDSYKDSGIEWIGDVPADWRVEPGRQCVVENKEKNAGMKEGTVLSLSYGRVIVKGEDDLTGLVPESFETYQVVRPGDIIIRGTDLQNDKTSLRTGLARDNGIITSAYINLRPKRRIDPAFLHYLLHSYDVKKVFYALGSGLRQNLSYDDFKYLRLPIPSTEEQRAITAFLDEKCAKVDEAVRIKEEQIALLRERRQILIQEAVTRGLNPDAPMKDSGIDWIGPIPDHWKVRRFRFLCSITTGGRNTEDRVEGGRYPFFVRSQTAERINSYSFDGEAVLTAGDGAGVGKVYHYYSGKFDFHQRVYKFSHFRGVAGRYIYHYLDANFFNVALLGTAKSTVDSLRLPLIQNFPVVFPPSPREQQEILQEISRWSEEIDEALSIKESQIAALKEYKTTLINAAVTGKIKVA